ncbi:MAG: DUF2723 domain-containing protein [Anaerolineales bacterium]|nr:MAG: DUF2723 domain-containing protein [Anaerolineales bacterium]
MVNAISAYSPLSWDGWVAVALFIAGLLAYVSTLAPTVLDGDAALFQYTPSVLGITYPTGYPTYILLGRLCAMFVPIGPVAYRMNLFSAVCGALALAFLYAALRRLLESRLAALLAVLTFGTLPTYWRWATEAKIYTLHILLLSGILFALSECVESGHQGHKSLRHPGIKQSADQGFGGWQPRQYPLVAALLFGLALGNHSTTVLLAPGLFLLFWLNCRSSHPTPGTPLPVGRASRSAPGASPFTPYVVRFACYLLPVVVLPTLLYLYVPLRAGWLLGREGTLAGLTVPVAVARGLVTDYYHPGWEGLIRYFTASDFTGGVVTNWGMLPSQLVAVYLPLVRDDFTILGAALGLVGAVYFAAWRPRRFWPLFLIYVILIPFVLTYGQGEQSAFLLPSSLMLAIFAGAAVAGGLRLLSWIRHWGSRIRDVPDASPPFSPYSLLSAVLALGLVAGLAWLPARQAQYNIDWLTDKWDDATYQYWVDVLAHPMERDAGVLAHWGDLTSFWYLQHVEGLRPDLYGLYPPTEEMVTQWLASERDLYIAGPLQGWAVGVETRYQLLPWGRLVRLAPHDVDPVTLLPDLPSAGDAIFGGRLRLLKKGFEAEVPSGGIMPVTLAWQAMGDLSPDDHLSLRLVAEDGTRVAQDDQALVSGWLPANSLSAGQALLSFHRFKLPTGTLPGEYQLQLALGGWPLADGSPALDLGRVIVTPADSSQPLDPWGEYKPLRGVDFGGQIRLVGYDYSVTRAGQGKGFALRLLWQSLRRPAADYTLLIELVDADGKVWRDWRHAPVDGRALTSTWAARQLVRDQVALVLPADAPPGEDTLRVRLSWQAAGDTRLPARRWFLPAGHSVTLPGVRVVEKEDRLFETPAMQHMASANFEDKIQLLGYDLPTARLSPGESLPVTLVWQSLTSDMRDSYTVFVHLVGPDGEIHGQWDKVPGERSKQPTTSWVRGEMIVDPISVPLSMSAPPGTYRVMVGFYLAPDGLRLLLHDPSGTKDDVLELTHIQVSQ